MSYSLITKQLAINYKSLGYDELIVPYVKSDGTLFDDTTPDYCDYVKDNGEEPYSKNSTLGPTEYSLPTIGETIDWLRLKTRVYVYAYPINLGDKDPTYFRVTVITPTSIDNVVQKYLTYDLALLKGLEDSETYLKEKKKKEENENDSIKTK